MSAYNEIKDQIQDIVTTTNDIEELRAICRLLLNIAEESANTIKKLTEQVQELRDEVNRLKGEKGKPTFKPKKPPEDHSSEDERKNKDKGKKDKKPKDKKHKITITRKEVCPINPSELPQDAIFKGYQSVIVQDLIISTDNIEFQKEVYYSPSLGKNITGILPSGYFGDFGPNIKTLILSLHNASNMTESAIIEFLTTHGVLISSASVARIILKGYEQFKDEKTAIIEAGLQSSDYQHIDDTGAKVNGKQNYTHVLCNPYYTAYFTRPDKSRLTLLEILSGGTLEYRFDTLAYELMKSMKLPDKALELVKIQNPALVLNQYEIAQLLTVIYPDQNSHKTARRIILEATAIAGYRNHPQAIQLLLCDDAPQFKQITQELALCWVHEGRHYKKLTPIVNEHRQELDSFLSRFWDYYRALLQFKELPTKEAVLQLDSNFDVLFNTPVDYIELANRMRKTVTKKYELLAVLRHPEVPLHNNPAEHGARAQARKRDISYQTKTNIGTLAKDTMMTVVQTAKKLGVNLYKYLHDRISGASSMPSLANTILNKNGIT
jgi:hypothetical protein